MTKGSGLLGRLLILLAVLIGLEVAALGGAVTTWCESSGGQGPVTLAVQGVHAVAKVAITVAGIVGKLASMLILESDGEGARTMGVFLPAAASTGGALLGSTWASEDCCGPDSPRARAESQADRAAGTAVVDRGKRELAI